VFGSSAADVQPQLEAANRLLRERRPAEASVMLRALLAQTPGRFEVRHLLGVALRDQGDLAGAERELRAALAGNAGQPALHGVLADVLLRAGRRAEAEAAFRRALSLDPGYGPAAVGLADLLLAAERLDEALAVTTAALAAATPNLNLWTAHARALRALWRIEEALEAYRSGVLAEPGSAVAEHNLAGLLGDMERFAESEQAARRAFAKGLDAPETWLVHGRALMGQAKLDEAESAFREATRRRPGDLEALTELAQLIWMRTEDLAAACAPLDAAIRDAPDAAGVRLVKARLLEYAGDRPGAYLELDVLLRAETRSASLHLRAAQLLAHSDPPRAAAHAETACRLAPGDVLAGQTLCAAWLADGRPADAARLALLLRDRAPLDQHTIGLLATAWRILDDPRAAAFRDYDALVRAQPIDTPDGWPDLAAYLADLGRSLERLHPLSTHPVGQSLRGGTQTLQGLDKSADPPIQAFFTAIDGPIRRYITALGAGDDPLRTRNNGGYRTNGIWSVRLRPHGHHVDHLHPMGWISSACHIALPGAVDRGHEGWLKFGEPGVPTSPALAPEHFVKPSPGHLVLFPSWMWHGTVPFGGDEPRLTVAFDLLPA
jgi:tetratricopeptide (TPR) repeat protein